MAVLHIMPAGGDDLLIADIYLIFVRIRSWGYNNYCLYLGMFPEKEDISKQCRDNHLLSANRRKY